jgi:hypothetical protein
MATTIGFSKIADRLRLATRLYWRRKSLLLLAVELVLEATALEAVQVVLYTKAT